MSQLSPSLDAATLVTVNKRLASELRRRHDTAQVDAGRGAWPTPDILPWGAWLHRAYAALVDAGHCRQDLLSPHQERVLWEQVITRDTDPTLLRPAAAAEAAQEAFGLCCGWLLSIDEVEAIGGQDTRGFARWHRRFRRELAHRGFMTLAELPGRVARAFRDGQLDVPESLYLAGFDQVPPAQQELLATITDAGGRVATWPAACGEARCRRVSAIDGEHEIRLAAQWAMAQLSARPDRRVAVISPTLGTHRRDIVRLFTRTLEPAAYLDADTAAASFNLSLGEPLSDLPLVAHALLALRLLGGGQSLADIGQLLRSPFVGGHTHEWEARALFDAELRRDGRPRLELTALLHRLRQVDRDEPAACPDLLVRLEGLAELHPPRQSARPPRHWSDHLREALKRLGWPGAHSLDSAEFQQYQRFLELFDELTALTKVRPRLTLIDAIGHLTRLARETVFQSQSAAKPIQVLGMLEAAGLEFDAIWLLGMDDRSWPAPARPNPLLPAALQREQGMPHASAERELIFATDLIEQLKLSTGEIIASFPLASGEPTALPSPLIADWPEVSAATLGLDDRDRLSDACEANAARRPMPDPVATPAAGDATGGAALLAAQARCPFAAVGQYRLRASPLDEPTHAPDPAMTGTLVHKALQRIWATLEDSATLGRKPDVELRRLVWTQVEAVLDLAAHRRPDLYSPRFRALETDRLTGLLVDWLHVERERRQPFEIVALERDQTIPLEGITLRTRADRIDRLADGSLAVIDYKTGRTVSLAGWFDDRLSEPQLPLYTLTSYSQVGATLLARVRGDPTGCRFIGLSRAADFGPGVVTPQEQDEALDWPRLLAHWQASIDELAAEVVAGRADPTPSPRVCQYCALGGLCRVQQRLTDADDE